MLEPAQVGTGHVPECVECQGSEPQKQILDEKECQISEYLIVQSKLLLHSKHPICIIYYIDTSGQ